MDSHLVDGAKEIGVRFLADIAFSEETAESGGSVAWQ
jgi:hypothetical protein